MLKQKLLVMASCFAWPRESDRKVAVPIYSRSCTDGITCHRYLYIYACTALKLNEISRASGEHMISREGEKTVDIIERIRPFSSKLFFFFFGETLPDCCAQARKRGSRENWKYAPANESSRRSRCSVFIWRNTWLTTGLHGALLV